MAGPVRYEVENGIAVATIASPPVNALSAAMRSGLADAVREAAADPAVRALVIAAEGRTWIAGADISEFGKPPASPTLAELIALIDSSPKPVVRWSFASTAGAKDQVVGVPSVAIERAAAAARVRSGPSGSSSAWRS